MTNEEILKKLKNLNESDPYLVTLTVYGDKDKGGLETFIVSNQFPFYEFEGTKTALMRLLDEHCTQGALKVNQPKK